jgi:hypothetical protein
MLYELKRAYTLLYALIRLVSALDARATDLYFRMRQLTTASPPLAHVYSRPTALPEYGITRFESPARIRTELIAPKGVAVRTALPP